MFGRSVSSRLRVVVVAALVSSLLVAADGQASAALERGAALGHVQPQAAGDTFLDGVTAVSPSSAWAVGTTGSDEYSGMVQHWDGTKWSTVETDLPDGSQGEYFTAVGASSDSDVWAVGSLLKPDYDNYGSALHWNGTTWTHITSPSLKRFWTSQLLGVTVVSPTDAWLVGFGYPRHTYLSVPIVLHWNGSTLNPVSVPHPTGNQSEFDSVSAWSSTDVWAVGYVTSGHSMATWNMVEHWNGTAWHRVAAPSPDKRADTLTSVTAVGPRSAWAVGYGPGTPVVEHTDGNGWQVSSLPKSEQQDEIWAVGGSSDSDVWLVGDQRTGNHSVTATLHWDGTAWVRVPSPTAGAFANLNGIVDNGPGKTWTVGGRSVHGSDDQTPIREEWTGHRWVLH